MKTQYNRQDFSLRQSYFVVKPFVAFGGFENVEVLQLDLISLTPPAEPPDGPPMGALDDGAEQE